MSQVRRPLGGSSHGSGPEQPFLTLVAAAVGYRKSHIPAIDAGEFGREIRDALGDEVGVVQGPLHHVCAGSKSTNRTIDRKRFELFHRQTPPFLRFFAHGPSPALCAA